MPMNSKSNLNEPLTPNAIHVLISQQHDVSQLEIPFNIGRREETRRERKKINKKNFYNNFEFPNQLLNCVIT